jgi:integrase
VTCAKKISTLKTLLNYAQKKEYGYCLTVNPEYHEFSIQRTDNKHEVIALTQEEYDAIRTVDLPDEQQQIARDIFVFSCNTGLRISDLEDLKAVHLVNGTIDKIAIKTGERIKIPLSKTAKAILSKYWGDPQQLMSIHRNDVNKLIKDVAKAAGITAHVEKIRHKGKEEITIVQPKYERISIHVGRKTFVTLMLSKEIPATDVMALSGHRSFAAFKRYVDVSQKQRESAIKKAFD